MVRLRYSTIRLLAVVTLTSIAFAVVSNWWHEYRRTRARLVVLCEAGVAWRYHFEGEVMEDGHSWNDQQSWFFKFVKSSSGLELEMFYDVEAMFFEPVPNRPLEESDFQILTTFIGLKYLQFERMKLGDECVPYLASMKHLRILNLSTSGMTEQGLNRLRQSLPDAKINSHW